MFVWNMIGLWGSAVLEDLEEGFVVWSLVFGGFHHYCHVLDPFRMGFV